MSPWCLNPGSWVEVGILSDAQGWWAESGLLVQGMQRQPGFAATATQTWAGILTLPLSSQEALSNFPDLSWPQFPYLQSGDLDPAL